MDLIDLKTGNRFGCFHNAYLSGIIQLNQFNRYGDCLASGMGYNGLIWKLPENVWKERSLEGKTDSSVEEFLQKCKSKSGSKRGRTSGGKNKEQEPRKKLLKTVECGKKSRKRKKE